MFGFAGDEGVGQAVSVLHPSPEDYRALGALVAARFAAGKPLRTGRDMRRRDGATFRVELTGYALDREKPAVGTVWMFDDRAACADPGIDGEVGTEREVRPACPRGKRVSSADDDAAAPENDPLFNVPDLDAVAGLRRVGGRMDGYRGLLRQFLLSQGGVVQHIYAALAAADFGLAARLAYLLKGGAGNIGAVPLSQIAAEVDHAIRGKSGRKAVKERLMRLDYALNALCIGLAAALGVAGPAGGQVSPARIVAMLTAALQRNDGEAADHFDAHADVLRGILPAADFDALAAAVRNYDFAAALARLAAVPESGNGGES